MLPSSDPRACDVTRSAPVVHRLVQVRWFRRKHLLADIFRPIPSISSPLRVKYEADQKEGSLRDRGFRSTWYLHRFIHMTQADESFLPISRIAGQFAPFPVTDLAIGSSLPPVRQELLPRENAVDQNEGFLMVPLLSGMEFDV